MEIIGILAVGLLLFLIVAPIIALAKARAARDEIEDLKFHLHRLEVELSKLRQTPPATHEAGEPAQPAPEQEEVIKPQSVPKSPVSPPPFLPVPEQRVQPPPFIPATEPSFAAEPVRESSPAPKVRMPSINWEQFMGVKLFAWIGGLALFIGVALFLKYSFERDLIPPEIRAALGFLTGIGMVIGGLTLSQKKYAVTAQTLCATGIVILYAVTFACRAVYHFAFFGPIPTFVLMVLLTATAFLLAVRLNALVVAVLGMLGGFLTPVLLSTGHDNPLGLFGYIVLLDAGLIAVALHRRWNFLTLMAAVGTVLMQLGWSEKFFEPAKIHTALNIFLTFNLLFLAAFYFARRLQRLNHWFSASALLLPLVTFGFTFYLLTIPELGQRPGLVFAFVLIADLCALAVVLLDEKLFAANLGAGLFSFLLLTTWTMQYLNAALLNWALGFYLLFAILHSVFPIVLQRLRPGTTPTWWAHLFPPIALLLMMAPIFKLTEVSLFLWPCVLLIDLLAIGLAVLTASLLSIVAVLLLTLAATALWIFKIPAELAGVPESLFLIGGFAIFFFVVGTFATRKILARMASQPAPDSSSPFSFSASPEALAQLPAFSALLPFLLLIMVTLKMPLQNPSPIFGLALLLIVLVLGVARAFRHDWLPALALASVLALEHSWHLRHFHPEHALVPLGWYLLFTAIFGMFPFLFRERFSERVPVWAAAALASPFHFYLVHRLVSAAYPNQFMGLLPAAFAIPSIASLVFLLRKVPAENPIKISQLAWFGGVTLFFITLIFPIQFDRQWITIGWALEGAALLWLFHRVPHPGLRLTGVALLGIAFVRLALNPAVLEYHTRSATPILNWYLYAYGVVAFSLFLGAKLMAAPHNQIFGKKIPPLLNGGGAILLFLLLNIEIADYFSTGTALTFQFSGNFARDMTYTIAWALFAFALLLFGIARKIPAARYAGIGLLSVTLLKLFFHDLANLKQLYRIVALISVAVIAMLASFIYQKFLNNVAPKNEPDTK